MTGTLPPVTTPDRAVWQHFPKAELDAAYNNTAAVPESRAILDSLTERSANTRRRSAIALDLRYGDGLRQTIDLFACGMFSWAGNRTQPPAPAPTAVAPLEEVPPTPP